MCICHFYFALEMCFLNGMMVSFYKGEKIIPDAVLHFTDAQLHPVSDGYDVGGIPPTLFLVFISNDSRDGKD